MEGDVRRWCLLVVASASIACGRPGLTGLTPEGSNPDSSPTDTATSSPAPSIPPAVQTFFYIDPVQITVTGEDTWSNVDVSSIVPAGATGVVLHVVNDSSDPLPTGLRMNGSSDDRTEPFNSQTHAWALIGLDGNRIFEAYEDELGEQDLYVVGYTIAGVEYFQDSIDVSPANASTWEVVDVSAFTNGAEPAVGVIVEVDGGFDYGVRAFGSTDDRRRFGRHVWDVVGLDDKGTFEAWIGDAGLRISMVGYITAGAVFFTDAPNKTLSTLDSWEPIDIGVDTHPTYTANGAFLNVYMTGLSATYGMRRAGSTENIVTRLCCRGLGVSELSSAETLEGFANDADVDFFLTGYTTSAP